MTSPLNRRPRPETEPRNMPFQQVTLDNGLEIVAECLPGAYSSAFAFFVKTGARDESDELSGVSHFLEHMAFKGTPTRSSLDVNRELDEMGSHSNAYTSEEQTVYYATVLPEYQDRMIDLLSDIMRPSLRDDDFEMEKKVILEEIAKYEDQPPYGAHEKCMAAHFVDHPLARSVLGTTQSVSALTPAQMRGYFEQRYNPGNIVLAAAGRVDFDRLVAAAQRCCGQWQRQDASRLTPRARPNRGSQLIAKPSATLQYTVEVANFPAAEDPDRYAARLLASIAGDDTGSRLFWELIDNGRAEYAGLASYEYQGTGILMSFLSCVPDDTQENLDIMHRVLSEVARDGVTEDELLRAKSKVCSSLILHAERPTNRMFSVGNNWVQRRTYRTVRDTVNLYQAVTCRDIAAVLEKYPFDARTTVSIGTLSDLKV